MQVFATVNPALNSIGISDFKAIEGKNPTEQFKPNFHYIPPATLTYEEKI
jgi:hypothetical protein